MSDPLIRRCLARAIRRTLLKFDGPSDPQTVRDVLLNVCLALAALR